MDVSDATPGTYPYGAFYRNVLTKSHDWIAGGLTRHAGLSLLWQKARRLWTLQI